MSLWGRIFRRSGDSTPTDPNLFAQPSSGGGEPQQAFGELRDEPWPEGDESPADDVGEGDQGQSEADSGGGDSGGGGNGGGGGGGE